MRSPRTRSINQHHTSSTTLLPNTPLFTLCPPSIMGDDDMDSPEKIAELNITQSTPAQIENLPLTSHEDPFWNSTEQAAPIFGGDYAASLLMMRQEVLNALESLRHLAKEQHNFLLYQSPLTYEVDPIVGVEDVCTTYLEQLDIVENRLHDYRTEARRLHEKATTYMDHIQFPEEHDFKIVKGTKRGDISCRLLMAGTNTSGWKPFKANDDNSSDIFSLQDSENNIGILRRASLHFCHQKAARFEVYKLSHPTIPWEKLHHNTYFYEHRAFQAEAIAPLPFARLLDIKVRDKGETVFSRADCMLLIKSCPTGEEGHYEYYDPVTGRAIERSAVSRTDYVFNLTEQGFVKLDQKLHWMIQRMNKKMTEEGTIVPNEFASKLVDVVGKLERTQLDPSDASQAPAKKRHRNDEDGDDDEEAGNGLDEIQ
ncbi:hypothetical protein BJ170DRAFT_307925 [Xylariales sp. AK1849]|nr:hypothetical protein BJ170DRAFT_307925 [Xylariales sp. AK1849]